MINYIFVYTHYIQVLEISTCIRRIIFCICKCILSH